MPTYTFPATIYIGPVITNPYKADEIECTISPPGTALPGGGTLAHWRARVHLAVNSQYGLSNGHASITLPRSTIIQPVVLPATITTVGFSMVGQTFTWTFASVPVNSAHDFYLDFTPNAGLDLTGAFEVDSQDLSSAVDQYQTFST